ncbi:TraR/DksA family transcriptional regulator [Streptosporangium sp. NPDC004631]
MNDVAVVLERKRAELEGTLAELSASPDEQGGISFGKRVGDWTSLAVERMSQVGSHERLRTMLADVRRAQVKLEKDTYGSCDRCGAAIAPGRLEALPWAVLCITCAGRR